MGRKVLTEIIRGGTAGCNIKTSLAVGNVIHNSCGNNIANHIFNRKAPTSYNISKNSVDDFLSVGFSK